MKISEQLNYGVKIVNDKIVYVIKLKDGTLFEFNQKNYKQVIKDIDTGKIDVDINWGK